MKNASLKLLLVSFLFSSQLYCVGNFYGDEEEGVRVYPFHLGPVQGEVTPTSARIWGRVDSLQDTRLATYPLLIGVLNYRENSPEKSTMKWRRKYYFLRQSDQYAGAIDLTLEPGKSYEYWTGYTFADTQDVLSGKSLLWPDADISPNEVIQKNYPFYRVTKDGFAISGLIKTPADNGVSACLFGSCHFWSPKAPVQEVANFFGIKKGGIWAREADETFRSMVRRTGELEKTFPGISVQILRQGDQVYVDYGNKAMRAETRNDVNDLYKNAWHIREENKALLANHGQRMIGDDHEGEDNMDQKIAEQSLIYRWASEGYNIHQGMLSPSYDPKSGILPRRWFVTSIGIVPTFVLDLRTKRVTGKEICEGTQFNALLQFLTNNTKGCFVISTIPVAPDYKQSDLDKWDGFKEQRNTLLDTIATNETRVVFFQGDVHWSGMGELKVNKKEVSSTKLEAKEESPIILATSSPFFWPFAWGEKPNDKKTGVNLKGELTSTKIASYTIENASKPVQDNGFGQAIVTPDGTLEISLFIEDDKKNPSGKLLEKRTYKNWLKQ